MSQQREMKKIDMETLQQSDRKVASGKAKKFIVAAFAVLVTAGAGYAAYRLVAGDIVASRFAVNKMNCPACVLTVKEITGKVPGVVGTDVSLAAQQVTVKYRERETSPEQIGELISKGGYTVHLDGVFDPEHQAASGPVIALVNGEPLFRHETAIPLMPTRLESPSDSVAESFFNSVGRKIVLQAADAKMVVVQPYEVEEVLKKAMDDQGLTREQFLEKATAQYGSVEKLHQVVAQRIAMGKFVNEHVLAGLTDAKERRRRVKSWVGTLFSGAEVNVLDAEYRETLYASAGDADWKTFWPRMIGRETDLKQVLLR